jgi:hypothetical protein
MKCPYYKFCKHYGVPNLCDYAKHTICGFYYDYKLKIKEVKKK